MSDALARLSPSDLVPSSGDAYDRLRGEIDQVPDDALLHVNIDPMLVVVTLTRAGQKLQALRADLSEELSKFRPAQIDELPELASALRHAHALYLATRKRKAEFAPLLARGKALRTLLFTDLCACIAHGLIPAAARTRLKRSTSTLALIQDLTILQVLFREHWHSINGRTALTPAELRKVDDVIHALSSQFDARNDTPAERRAATRTRARAFTLALRRYEEVRHGVLYVRRHHGDAESWAPSLYAVRHADAKKRAPRKPRAQRTQRT